MTRTLLLVVGSLLVACGSAALGSASSVSDGGALERDAIAGPSGDGAGPPSPLAPDLATEQCSQNYVLDGLTYLYAEHAYPGKSMTDLARVTALGHTLPGMNQVDNWPAETRSVSVRDGYVAVSCGTTAVQVLDSVIFVF